FQGCGGKKPKSFGYRYGGDLDGLARSHTLAAQELLVNSRLNYPFFTHKFCYRAKFVMVFRCRTTFERELTLVGTLQMLAAASEDCGAPIIAGKLRAAFTNLNGTDIS